LFILAERLKTEDEKLKEEKEKLERLEADRLRRMRGETDEAARGAAVSVEDMQVGTGCPEVQIRPLEALPSVWRTCS
jgi:hypothetical protein